jgi:FKBP-type peptidyl-prolyl cis-trans isomerase FkpA
MMSISPNYSFCKKIFMRILPGCLVAATLFFTSCLKKDGCTYKADDAVAPAAEQQILKGYIDSVGISATLHPNGFYYHVVSQGADVTPAPCSQITVAYKGQLTNGNIFDQQSNWVAQLGGLIDGWQEGMPLIKKGGRIMLYIPPSLGYGANGSPTIPPNSILIFDITLINVQ